MSKAKYFLLFCSKGSQPPRMYKTKATVERHKQRNPSLMYEQFNDVQTMEQRLRELTSRGAGVKQKSNIISVKDDIHTNTPTNRADASNFTPPDIASVENSRVAEIRKFMQARPEVFAGFEPSVLIEAPAPKEIDLYFDGSSLRNPGPSGIGYLGVVGKTLYFAKHSHLGHRTNNQSEFTSLLWGIADCAIKQIPVVRAMGDSKLVIEGMRKNWNIVEKGLLPYYHACLDLERFFRKVNYRHISRRENQDADKLSKRGSNNP